MTVMMVTGNAPVLPTSLKMLFYPTRTMTATIEAIDPKVPSITFKGPKGWKYSRRVLDKDVLKQVKVGDEVDFTWTEAVTLEVSTPKK